MTRYLTVLAAVVFAAGAIGLGQEKQDKGGQAGGGVKEGGLAKAPPKDAPKLVHTSEDAFKCKACSGPLQKALAYLDKNGPSADGYRHIFMGYLWLAMGNEQELKRSINAASGGFYKQKSFNENWATCMAALFLAECFRRNPSDKLRNSLTEILKVANERMEKTGGWGHHLGYADESGYNKIGGGTDLGILTAEMYGAMLIMKSHGIEVPPEMMKRVEDNLEKASDGQGICYATDNKFGDVAMSRGSFAYIGIHGSGITTSKLAKTVPQGLKARYKEIHVGHAYPPLHYTASPIALHLLGPEYYNPFATFWIDKLISLQKEDGSIELPHSEGKTLQKEDKYLASTSSFALILVLQQPGIYERGVPKAGRKNMGPGFVGGRAERLGFGVSILSLIDKGPGQKAGLAANDVITELNGKAFKDFAELKKTIEEAKSGSTVRLTVMRAGEKKTISVVLGDKPKRDEDSVASESPDGEEF